MKKFLAIFLALNLCFVWSAAAQKKLVTKTFTTSGNFNGIEMTSKESGDYGGVSVYLTESDGQMYALVMIAEGGIFPPVLVEARVSGKNMREIEFSLPKDENGTERNFKGTVSAAGLKLSGDPSILKRSCGGAKTYGNISYGKKSGDYGGLEMYLTDTGGQWYALVTIAEGVLHRPVLVEANVTGKNFNKVEFKLPTDSGERKFTGTISPQTGSLTLDENGTRSVLKSKCYR